jgi:hypothetical protein
MAYRIRS